MLQRLALVYLRPLLKNCVYTIRNGVAKGLLRKGGLAFLPKPMSREHAFLLQQDFTGRTLYDIGGWEGVFTIFFARATGPAGRVVTFEPNPENCAVIRDNVALNGFTNVILRPVALGRAPRKTTLAIRGHESGTGSFQDDLRARILKEAGARTLEIDVDTLDHQLETGSLPPPDFVKIDVEGMELEVLEGMAETVRRVKPRLFVEIHESGARNSVPHAQAVIRWLSDRGYAIQHVESDRPVSVENAADVIAQHVICE